MIVTADPTECSFQFKATGTEKFTTGCDIVKSALVGLSVNYENVAAPKGTVASVKIGEQASDRPIRQRRRRGDRRRASRRTAIRPAPIRTRSTTSMTVLLLTILVVYVTMVYGPIAAWLVETVPDPHPLQRPVAALSHRQRLVRRLPAGDRVRDRGGDRQHLFRPVVSDHHRGDELRRRVDLPAGDQGRDITRM